MDPLETPIKVTAAVLVKDEKILIARRRSGDRLEGRWEFPGGKIEAGESAVECLQRELKEEFDIEIEVGRFLGSSIHRYPHISIELIVFRARWTAGSLIVNEHAEQRWVTVAELDRFEFAPADLPFVRRLCAGEIDLQFE